MIAQTRIEWRCRDEHLKNLAANSGPVWYWRLRRGGTNVQSFRKLTPSVMDSRITQQGSVCKPYWSTTKLSIFKSLEFFTTALCRLVTKHKCTYSKGHLGRIARSAGLMGITHKLTHWGRVTHICVVKLTIIGLCDKPLSKPMLEYCSLNPWEQVSVKCWSEFKIIFHDNALENVACEMASILSRPQCVNMCCRLEAMLP